VRKFAISDIHGTRRTFLALLDKIQLTTADELYLLGDYIDRGPDSKGVIDEIWQLQAAGYQVHCLRGNHEQLLLDLIAAPTEYWGIAYPDRQMYRSFGIKAAHDLPLVYYEWMQQLPFFFTVDEYLLVHAGLNFRAAFPLLDRSAMLWIRDWRAVIDRSWLKGRIIVHGHTPTPRNVIENYLATVDQTPVLVIDNGCVYPHIQGMGSLCALELMERQLFFQELVG